MIALDREVADAELAALAAGAQPRLEVADETAAAQRGNIALHAQRDVRRAAVRHVRAPDVVYGRALRCGLPSGTLAPAAMTAKPQLELLPAFRHAVEYSYLLCYVNGSVGSNALCA